jgi:hypothetical protein
MAEVIPVEDIMSRLISEVLEKVQSQLPKNDDGTPIVEMKTIWHIVELTIEVVEMVKNKEKFNGNRAKQLTLATLKVLIANFAPDTPENPVKQHLLDLHENSIPAAIDLVFNASKGKIKINNADDLIQLGLKYKALADLDGDGDVDCNDLCRLKKLFCCCCKK